MNTRISARATAALLGGLLVAASIAAVAPATASVTPDPVLGGAHNVYAVLITPSNVTGNVADSSQTAAKVATAVSAASTYWAKQSANVVKFALAGTSTFTKSGFSCDPNHHETDDLIDQATDIATETLGYEAGVNTHLLVVLPASVTTECGDISALTTLGTSATSGGTVVNIGSDSASSKAALNAALGRNLSLGQADWLNCSVANPVLVNGTSHDCKTEAGGDSYDVLGNPVAGKTGGALSSPSAIRSGLWGAGAYSVAIQGANKVHTLKAVSSGSGKRAVVVEGRDGVNYFVEYRNFSGLDALSTVGCTPSNADEHVAASCVPETSGIRILRLENPEYGTQYKSLRGDNSVLIGRTVGGVPKVNYTVGQVFSPGASSGIQVRVTAITATTATVAVTRLANPASTGTVTILPSIDLDGDLATAQVGDVWSTALGSQWEGDSYTYQWYRGTKKITGATKVNYKLVTADIGKNISLDVYAKSLTKKSAVVHATGFDGAVTAGVLNAGTVAVSGSGSTLTAKISSWNTPSTLFAYQWFKNGSPIAKATRSAYIPASADKDALFSVRVTGSRSGFNTVVVTTTPRDYWTNTTGTPTLSGTYRVGGSVEVTEPLYFNEHGAVVPTLTYQWYRGATKITGATAPIYTFTASDYNKTLTVKIAGGIVGNINTGFTSPATPVIAKGVIQGTKVAPVIVVGTSSLSVTHPAGSIIEPSVKSTYRWLRDGVAITNAIKPTYTLTASDFNKSITVQVEMTKTNYTTITLSSVGGNYSIISQGAPFASDLTPTVGDQLTVSSAATYLLNGQLYGSHDLTIETQWLANGTAIAGATGTQLQVSPALAGKVLTARITAKKAGWVSSVLTTAPTAAVVAP